MKKWLKLLNLNIFASLNLETLLLIRKKQLEIKSLTSPVRLNF